jgi:hypothetical protein
VTSEATFSDPPTDREQGAPKKSFGRSIGAVGVGTVVGILLTLGTDAASYGVGILPRAGGIPTTGALLLATIYRCVYAVVGSYVIALMAPNRPMMHALVGGFLGVLASTVGAVATWNKGPEFGAHWYPIALIVTALPCAWLGGKLRLSQSPKPAAA